MLMPPRRHFRGNEEQNFHVSYLRPEESIKDSKNKVFFLILLGVALLFYGAALIYIT